MASVSVALLGDPLRSALKCRASEFHAWSTPGKRPGSARILGALVHGRSSSSAGTPACDQVHGGVRWRRDPGPRPRGCASSGAPDEADSPGKEEVPLHGLGVWRRGPAIACTLIETAKRNGLDPQTWFTPVPGRISDYQINRIDDLITISSRHTPMSDFDRWCDSAPDCPLSIRAR